MEKYNTKGSWVQFILGKSNNWNGDYEVKTARMKSSDPFCKHRVFALMSNLQNQGFSKMMVGRVRLGCTQVVQTCYAICSPCGLKCVCGGGCCYTFSSSSLNSGLWLHPILFPQGIPVRDKSTPKSSKPDEHPEKKFYVAFNEMRHLFVVLVPAAGSGTDFQLAHEEG